MTRRWGVPRSPIPSTPRGITELVRMVDSWMFRPRRRVTRMKRGGFRELSGTVSLALRQKHQRCIRATMTTHPALLIQMFLAVVGISCDSRSAPTRNAIDTDYNPYHGYPASRYDAAERALWPLLRFRAATGLTEFDSAIRELTRVSCAGAPEAVILSVQTASVPSLYPLDRLQACKALTCGGCIVSSETFLLGPNFVERPKLEPPGLE